MTRRRKKWSFENRSVITRLGFGAASSAHRQPAWQRANKKCIQQNAEQGSSQHGVLHIGAQQLAIARDPREDIREFANLSQANRDQQRGSQWVTKQ